MKTFFDPAVQEELRVRLASLEAGSPRQWGTMTPAQMLGHCTAALRMPLGELTVKASPLRLIGWLFKGRVTQEAPIRHNLPTAPEFVMGQPLGFEEERGRLREALGKLAAGPEAIRNPRHAFFGTLSSTQWGVLAYRHLDHHFRQFGA